MKRHSFKVWLGRRDGQPDRAILSGHKKRLTAKQILWPAMIQVPQIQITAINFS